MTEDIDDITVMAGTSGHEFKGIFDGDGHTISVKYGGYKNPITYTNAAPFSYVRDATIKNLSTDGVIYTAAKYAGGLVGSEWGDVTIENCRVSVSIVSYVNGDGTHGGIVGLNNKVSGTGLIIRGCVFDGKLLGRNTNKCGGFIGWRSGTADI